MDAAQDQRIGEASDAQPMRRLAFASLFLLRQRVARHIDDIVEQPDRHRREVFQPLLIEPALALNGSSISAARLMEPRRQAP